MRLQMSFLVLAAVVGCACAGSLPSFIKACSKSDPNLNKCVQDMIAIAGPIFAKGIPEFGIKPLDPVELGTVVANNPALKITFEDTVVTGLAGFRVNSYKIQPDKGKAILDFTANVTLKGHYDMNGQVLILPIKGNGQAKIKISTFESSSINMINEATTGSECCSYREEPARNCANLNIVINYEFKTVDGFWKVTSHKDSYKMDRAHFKFTNLFNGNRQLADTIHAVINENWEPVIRDIAPTTFQHVINACVDETKKLFAAVPADQLLLPL